MNRLALLALCLGLTAAACRVTGQSARPAGIGQIRSAAAFDAIIGRPGPLTLEKVRAADWSVPLSGLLNLDHDRARKSGLADRDEPIQIYFYVLRHPTRGTFLVDSGVQRAINATHEKVKQESIIGGLVGRFMSTERMRVHLSTAAWLAQERARGGKAPAGVFLTHLHLDHALGLPDLPAGTAVYVGPGEGQTRAFAHAFVQGTTDRALEKHDLRELSFAGVSEGFLDVFGDGSLFAVHVPGHTPGNLAFVARTPAGPVLMTGDACHTAWGWQNEVEPGTYSEDRPQSARSLARLRALVARHPAMRVHPGHQELTSPVQAAR